MHDLGSVSRASEEVRKLFVIDRDETYLSFILFFEFGDILLNGDFIFVSFRVDRIEKVVQTQIKTYFRPLSALLYEWPNPSVIDIPKLGRIIFVSCKQCKNHCHSLPNYLCNVIHVILWQKFCKSIAAQTWEDWMSGRYYKHMNEK